MSICKCPAATALPDIEKVLCGESFGQIQKIAFQRLYTDGNIKNSFTTAQPITAKASWTTLTTAEDSSKVVISPYVQAPATEVGSAITFGGGNESVDGIEEVLSTEPTTFTGVFRSVPQSIIKALKEIACESRGRNLGVYLFDGNGNIEAIKGDTEGTYYPIPIYSCFIGDKNHGGLEEPDSNSIQWSFAPNYSDDLAIVTPEFNPISEL